MKNKSEKAVEYMIDVWDEVRGNWREKPDHVEQMFLEAECEQQSNITERGESLSKDNKIIIDDIVEIGDVVFIEHLETFYEVLDVRGEKLIVSVANSGEREELTIEKKDIDNLWLQSHGI